jgi:cell division protein FtsN
MNSTSVILFACAFLLSCCLGACTASSELGEDHPEAPAAAQPDTTAVVPPVVKPSAPAQTNRQGFTTKEDTIEVESAQRSRRSDHTPITVQPRVAPAPRAPYAVQIGAFKDAQNASRAVERLAQRYAHATAAKQYDEALKLYRVTVGEFMTEKEALRFAAGLKKKYPREYSHAWVVRISQ